MQCIQLGLERIALPFVTGPPVTELLVLPLENLQLRGLGVCLRPQVNHLSLQPSHLSLQLSDSLLQASFVPPQQVPLRVSRVVLPVAVPAALPEVLYHGILCEIFKILKMAVKYSRFSRWLKISNPARVRPICA